MISILNIETATNICSISLAQDSKLIALQEIQEMNQQAAQITLLIEACMQAANMSLSDLDAVAISTGPGSYTALRIGTSVAKGICYALDKPLIAVDTLQSLAWASAQIYKDPDVLFCPMIDARRMEVYTAIFNAQNQNLYETEAKVLNENSFLNFFDKSQKIIFCGNGAKKFQAIINSPYAQFMDIMTSAAHLAALSFEAFKEKKYQNIAYYIPMYLKDPNITTSKKLIF